MPDLVYGVSLAVSYPDVTPLGEPGLRIPPGKAPPAAEFGSMRSRRRLRRREPRRWRSSAWPSRPAATLRAAGAVLGPARPDGPLAAHQDVPATTDA